MRLLRRLASVALAACLLGGAAPARAALGDDAALLRLTTVSLEAEGEVKAEPDQASISFGVQTQAATAAGAMRDNRTRMSAVLAALKTAGVEGKDVQTSSLRLNGQYAYVANQPPKLTGYQAVNQVTITVRDLAKLGSTVDAVTAAGVNEIGGIDFGLADPATTQDEARRRAVKLLAARAALYAEASGLKLGRLITLSEGGAEPSPIRPVVFGVNAAMRMKESPTPVEPGELTVRVSVQATYELTR